MGPTLEVRNSVSSLLQKSHPTTSFQRRLALRIIPTLLLAFVATFAYAGNDNRLNNIKTIVVFGDSLSDTGNDFQLLSSNGVPFPSPLLYPNLPDYTVGRFTDGADTTPYARKYFGVWVEQFAASLPLRPEVRNSLAGGTDYAYGWAASGNGTSPTTLPLPIRVDNVGQQIADYLSTQPAIDDSTLFIVWGGANDFLHPPASGVNPLGSALNMLGNIETLIGAGATQIIVANLPPMGLTPAAAAGGADKAALATQASWYFNYVLAQGITGIRAASTQKNLRIFQLDVFSLFNQIVDSPTRYSLMNVTAPSQWDAVKNPDTSLVNPDTYLFWDDVHPTTRGHNILADAAKHLVSEHACDATGEDCIYPVPQQCNGKHCAPVN